MITRPYIWEMENVLYLTDGKIDMSDEGIAYWTKKLKCDESRLRDALCVIGNNYNVLKLYLELNRLIEVE